MHVLILEDDPDLLEVWRSCVEDCGHTCIAVMSVSNAFDALHIHRFDLVLMDLQLQDGSSVGVSHYAKTIQPNCKILMITGKMVFTSGDHLQHAPGVDWLLRKPVSVTDLSAMITYAAKDQSEHHPLQHSESN